VAEDYLAESDAKSESAETEAPKGKPGRKPLPADLPRVRIEHDLPEADKPPARIFNNLGGDNYPDTGGGVTPISITAAINFQHSTQARYRPALLLFADQRKPLIESCIKRAEAFFKISLSPSSSFILRSSSRIFS